MFLNICYHQFRIHILSEGRKMGMEYKQLLEHCSTLLSLGTINGILQSIKKQQEESEDEGTR